MINQLYFIFSDGNIHVAAWKPDMIKCWNVDLQYIDKESEKIKENQSSLLKVNVEAAHSFCPGRLGDQIQASNSPWHQANRSKLLMIDTIN